MQNYGNEVAFLSLSRTWLSIDNLVQMGFSLSLVGSGLNRIKVSFAFFKPQYYSTYIYG